MRNEVVKDEHMLEVYDFPDKTWASLLHLQLWICYEIRVGVKSFFFLFNLHKAFYCVSCKQVGLVP